MQQFERLLAAHADAPAVVACFARAQAAVTEECCTLEAEAALVRLRRLVADFPDHDEPRRQLCFALFNRYCDEGLDSYLDELRLAAAPLPDAADLTGPAGLAGCLGEDDD